VRAAAESHRCRRATRCRTTSHRRRAVWNSGRPSHRGSSAVRRSVLHQTALLATIFTFATRWCPRRHSSACLLAYPRRSAATAPVLRALPRLADRDMSASCGGSLRRGRPEGLLTFHTGFNVRVVVGDEPVRARVVREHLIFCRFRSSPVSRSVRRWHVCGPMIQGPCNAAGFYPGHAQTHRPHTVAVVGAPRCRLFIVCHGVVIRLICCVLTIHTSHRHANSVSVSVSFFCSCELLAGSLLAMNHRLRMHAPGEPDSRAHPHGERDYTHGTASNHGFDCNLPLPIMGRSPRSSPMYSRTRSAASPSFVGAESFCCTVAVGRNVVFPYYLSKNGNPYIESRT